MSAQPIGDEVRPLYRAVVGLGIAALLILGLGIADFLYFEPFGQHTGTTARVTGIYRYDASSHRVVGEPATRFTVDDAFAAVVDWSSLPSSMTVAARWYNSLDVTVGGVGPAPAGRLSGHEVVPVKLPSGFSKNLPGQYVFVVERISGGQPVELLAREQVLVRRTP